MKRNLSLICVAAILASSCSKDESYPPVLSVSVTSVTVSNDGGSYGFTYSVENPVSGGTLSCEADAYWIDDIEVSGSEVSFTVLENIGVDSRTATLTLLYNSSYGALTRTVTVAQSPGTVPEVLVDPAYILADIHGGDYSFTYSIVNPVEGGSVSCTSEQSWITDIDCSVDGTVSFSVAEKTGEALRSGIITIVYSYGTGSVSGTFTVIQDYGLDRSGGGDVSEIIGTYTASGRLVVSDYSTVDEDATWTLKVREYTGTEGYDVYVEGWSCCVENYYTYYGSVNYLLGGYYYPDGRLVIPTQITNIITGIDDYIYNLGFTPCTSYDSASGVGYDPNWPALTYTKTGSDTWESDYGIDVPACSSIWIHTYYSVMEALTPTITLTKTSSSTD